MNYLSFHKLLFTTLAYSSIICSKTIAFGFPLAAQDGGESGIGGEAQGWRARRPAVTFPNLGKQTRIVPNFFSLTFFSLPYKS